MSKRRVVHYVKSLYDVVPWAETGTTESPQAPQIRARVQSGVTTFTVPNGFRRLMGLQPICGATMRPVTERRRMSDGVTCKRCLALAKKIDQRKKDRGFAARQRMAEP